MAKVKWAYTKNPNFVKSLAAAKKRVANWPEAYRESVESVRVYRRAQSRRAHED